jgi:hypothetical protein
VDPFGLEKDPFNDNYDDDWLCKLAKDKNGQHLISRGDFEKLYKETVGKPIRSGAMELLNQGCIGLCAIRVGCPKKSCNRSQSGKD